MHILLYGGAHESVGMIVSRFGGTAVSLEYGACREQRASSRQSLERLAVIIDEYFNIVGVASIWLIDYQPRGTST